MYIPTPCDLFFRCSAADAGKYKVVAKSSLGEATTYATLLVNCESSIYVTDFSGANLYSLDGILKLNQVINAIIRLTSNIGQF